ncbi:MAG TPA: hypothetical protein VFJ85_13045 [Acidimicrobiales bacterium]|nr:hypothetical protein [Acidimicrobiales bacterium]
MSIVVKGALLAHSRRELAEGLAGSFLFLGFVFVVAWIFDRP